MKKVNYLCDIDSCNNKVFEDKIERKVQVIFTTEQTEGRALKVYHLDHLSMDICENCYKKILNGEAIWAHGAQGYNNFYFKEKAK